MGGNRKKGQQRQGICTYCGAEGLVTDDHIFPKVIFLELDQDMVTVPTCEPCNQHKSLGDRDLRNYILLDVGGSQHPDAVGLTERMLRESNVRLRSWVRRTVDEAEEIDLVTDDGIIVGRALSFDFNIDRIITSQEMVARGLYFHETGQRLPPECPVVAERVPWNASPRFVQNLNSRAPTAVRSRGNNTVWWGYNTIAEAEPQDTVWQVCYHNWVLFFIATGLAAICAREVQQAAEARRQIRGGLLLTERNQLVVSRDPDGRPIIPPQ
jgi:hypothetical protein